MDEKPDPARIFVIRRFFDHVGCREPGEMLARFFRMVNASDVEILSLRSELGVVEERK